MKRIGLILVGLISLAVSGCGSSKVVTVDVPKIEKEYIVSTDTVHRVDSVYISNDRYIIGDTVVVSKYVDRFKYIYKMRTDTLVRTDTITIVNTEQIEALTKENDALRNVNYFYKRIGILFLVIIGCLVLLVALKRK